MGAEVEPTEQKTLFRLARARGDALNKTDEKKYPAVGGWLRILINILRLGVDLDAKEYIDSPLMCDQGRT